MSSPLAGLVCFSAALYRQNYLLGDGNDYPWDGVSIDLFCHDASALAMMRSRLYAWRNEVDHDHARSVV